MLVKMPDGTWLNPQHVAGVELERMRTDVKTWIHFAKASSFRVQALSLPGDRRDEIAMLINRGEVAMGLQITKEMAEQAINDPTLNPEVADGEKLDREAPKPE